MDEFTFPTIPREQCKLPFPHFASPPPWFVAGEDRAGVAANASSRSGGSGWLVVNEEKMDMLWEDFNEELTRAPPLCPLKRGLQEAWQADATASDEKDKRQQELAGSMVPRRRLSLLLMLKLLKKLFSVQKPSAPKKTPI